MNKSNVNFPNCKIT